MRARLTEPGKSVRDLWFQDLLATIASIPMRVMVMTSLKCNAGITNHPG